MSKIWIKLTPNRSLACRVLTRRALATAAQKTSVPQQTRPKKSLVHSKSFVQNIFRGVVETEQMYPYPQVLSSDQSDTLRMLIHPTEKFFVEVNDPAKNDALESIPEDVMQNLRELGAFGLQVPLELGGLGLSNTQYARLTEIVGANDLGCGIFIGAHQSIGFKGILIQGTEEQKAKYLPKLAAGELVAAFALTESSSGSDAGSIRTRAIPSADGKSYVLNGSKIWISNGGIADVFTVFAQTPVKDSTTGVETDKVTAFIVERKFGGVSSGPPEKKMGIKCSNTAEVYFENTPVPAENVLGEVGEGFKVAMQILNNGRFGMASSLTGTMKMAIIKAIDHASNRSQFGSKISTYGAIQEKIARMCLAHYVTESMAYMVSGVMDSGHSDYQLEAAISKVYASESAWFVVDESIQILGGMGYMKGSGLERVMRDLRIFRIFEGTNDILRLFVALTGLQYAGTHLRELQNAIKDPISNFGVFLGEVTKRSASAIGLGGSNALAQHVHPNLLDASASLSKSIQLFGGTVEKVLIKHGKNIIKEQFLLNRLSQAAIDIYAVSCLLSRCTQSLNHGLSSAAHEELMTKTFAFEANQRIFNNLTILKDPSFLTMFKDMSSISNNVCSAGMPVQKNPLGF